MVPGKTKIWKISVFFLCMGVCSGWDSGNLENLCPCVPTLHKNTLLATFENGGGGCVVNGGGGWRRRMCYQMEEEDVLTPSGSTSTDLMYMYI